MAQQIKCEYCGNFIQTTEGVCPYCGGPNDNYQREDFNVPKTIEELKKWYEDRHLPPEEVTRFFIGKDKKEPKCFGIYQDGPNFVVYKNKDTGKRAVRYEGTDEEFAVRELYLKLKEEIIHQTVIHQTGKRKSTNPSDDVPSKSLSPAEAKRKKKRKRNIKDGIKEWFFTFLIVLVLVIFCAFAKNVFHNVTGCLGASCHGLRSSYSYQMDNDNSRNDWEWEWDWDNDSSDFDWDSGSDWDSGGSDWSSDW